ncbi:hypothetical protein VNO78_07944 [Psophocarpus tetragonolobus]|uniref:Uncharacterized protein n=1 Tax=Psophocarpus tetragonolobus TaxID=3891 RepID=A0AAN9SWB5_PSOTE
MAMPVNNCHSEKERYEKSLVENGECTFLARPMYKRRKFSAVRDFPDECGPFASRIDPVLNINIAGCCAGNGTIVEDKNAEHLEGDTLKISNCKNDDRDYEVKDSFLTEGLGQTIDSPLNKGSPIALSHQVNGSIAKDEPLKVSIDQNENFIGSSHNVDGPIVEDEVAKVMLDQTTDCSLNQENPVVSSHQTDGYIVETTDCALNKESPMVSSLVDRLALEDEAAKEPLVDTKTLQIEYTRTTNNLLESSPVGEVVILGGSKSLSSNVNIFDSSACIVEPVTRRYLPRRKVSAVRNFPLLCGRNANHLCKDKDVHNSQDEYGRKRKFVDIVQTDFDNSAEEKVKKLHVSEPLSEMKIPLEDNSEKYATLLEKSIHKQVKVNSKALVKVKNRDETKPLYISHSKHKLKGNLDGLRREVVQGLMANSECPWSSGKGSSKFKLFNGKSNDKQRKVDSSALVCLSQTTIKTKGALNHSRQKHSKKKKANAASEGMGELVIWEKEDCTDACENNEDLQIVLKSHEFNVNITPSSHSNFTGDANDSNVTRKKVRETLRLFQVICRKLLHEIESNVNEGAKSKRVDTLAAKILKENGKYVNSGKQILGIVPGIEVGDEFQYRVELIIVGLHRQTQSGIDYVKANGMILATSIVASGAYADDLDNSDILIYTGQGGNVMSTDKEPEDQKLERGNLALKNSIEEGNPVRVIRGFESIDGKCKTYVYDGLYLVESYWQDVGPHGKLIYRFRLRRKTGQAELALKEVKKSKKFKTREGLCIDDISHGKERIPICAVNTIDDEKPPPFNYITSMIYPNCLLVPSKGCDCTNGCSDLKKCSCVVKNGGEIPFNHNEAIVEAKPLVYECGPTCKCPSTCHNRVSQLGIKFQLEIFKTNTRGWGVRSLNSIPSGSFICEYIGELLEEKEAEQRTGNDEYLFDIGNNYSNSTLWDGLSTLMPDAQRTSCEVVKDGGFTIDAAQFGNVGRFINHSCSPNLYAQNVLYDHHDTRMPHIMFFAAENIPPLQELTYDYNYEIDQVWDSDGNIKKKYCHCGSMECTGRMY